METKKLDFSTTLKDAISIGLKNAPSVIAAVILWLITIWVPYINVGTTIAITMLPTQLAKGKIINPLSIFESKYRRYMGEYFITMGLMVFPILIGVLFMIVPAIVLSIAWTLSYYFLFEKGKNPIQAIKASNDATYGSKWTMFAVQLVVGIIVWRKPLVYASRSLSLLKKDGASIASGSPLVRNASQDTRDSMDSKTINFPYIFIGHQNLRFTPRLMTRIGG